MPGLRLSSETLPAPRLRPWPLLLRGTDRLARFFHRVPHLLPIHVLGQQGEDLAYWCLREHGYTIVARNYRRSARQPTPEGEIDLIAYEGLPSALVFVEVKTRTEEGEFPAEAAVDAAKRQHLIRLARAYRRRRGYRGPYRFDVVVIYGLQSGHPRIKLHRDAFRD